MVENGEIRRTIKYLMDNDINFTSISGQHSKVASAMALNVYMPTKTSFLICSHGSEIQSLKRKKVLSRVLIDNTSMKEADKVVRRFDFDLCQIIFVDLSEKSGDVYM